uniref:EOG090X0ESA n=1 Tax=Daphnia similis TaxID=35528 RepID=A0A4Y7LZ11_9CRUS|nr:EOG090X0ESA [Daphnia similis]SVE71344.1 EOG090X0ESA [Daphnia similis]SVE71976.1 EOG090X0ESA [Daphnia similis]SVE72603.1 EOG090X0ESA [Daphnia similis]
MDSRQNDFNSSVYSNRNLAPLSPYLNFDPSYLKSSQPEFIFPEGASRHRGRFELAFSTIGGMCMIGGAIGGVSGLVQGIKDTSAAGHTGKLRRTQLINYIMKQGAGSANTLGVAAVMYSAFGVGLSWLRDTEDEINTLAAASATGLLYKSTSGLKSCLKGGASGLALALVYCAFTSREKITSWTSS